MPQRYQRPYPPKFGREAVSLVKVSGRSVREVAGELGVSYESLRLWLSSRISSIAVSATTG
jgi:transposase-like protein